MFHGYFIDIVIMMLNVIPQYNEILFTIINTINKITTTSSIYFAITHYFGSCDNSDQRQTDRPGIYRNIFRFPILSRCIKDQDFVKSSL